MTGFSSRTHDIDGAVQLIADRISSFFLSCGIGTDFQTIIHGSHFIVLAIAVVLDARSLSDSRFLAIFVFDDRLDILAIIQRSRLEIRRDVDGDTILARRTVSALLASWAGQADMADAARTRDGDCILAVFASDADFAIDTIFASNTVRAGDRNARLAVFAIFTGDKETVFAIFTIFAIVADDDGRTALGFNGDFAIFAVLADGDLVVEGNLDSIAVYSGLDIALFGNCTICIVDKYRP